MQTQSCHIKGVEDVKGGARLQTAFPLPTKPWAVQTHTVQTFLLANVVAETTKYAKLRPANIHLARWEQINDIENNGDMVRRPRGVDAIFQGKEKATNKSRHCLSGNLPLCFSYN